MNRKELEKLVCEAFRLRLGDVKLAMTGNKVALVERLYLHLQDPSSEPEPEHEDVPDATPVSEDSSESSSEGATSKSTPYIFNQPFTGSWPPTMQQIRFTSLMNSSWLAHLDNPPVVSQRKPCLECARGWGSQLPWTSWKVQ
eukprot:Em0595g4a